MAEQLDSAAMPARAPAIISLAGRVCGTDLAEMRFGRRAVLLLIDFL
ncbi:hypothetical protein [Nitrosospira sp. Nsp11]|nr:hypothetical protein [Nitrosospira sp. Nsp11]